MAKVLDRNIECDGVFYPKGSTPKKEHLEELTKYLADARDVELADEEVITSQTSTSFNSDDLTVSQIMAQIKELGATDEELADYKKLKKADLVVVHQEMLKAKADAEANA